MKKSEKQAFYLSPRPRTPGRFPDPWSRLAKKRKGSQGRRDCFLKRPKTSPPSKHLQVPEIERAPGAEQLGGQTPWWNLPYLSQGLAGHRLPSPLHWARPEAFTHPERSSNLCLQAQSPLQPRRSGQSAAYVDLVGGPKLPGSALVTPPLLAVCLAIADSKEHASSVYPMAQPSLALLQALLVRAASRSRAGGYPDNTPLSRAPKLFPLGTPFHFRNYLSTSTRQVYKIGTQINHVLMINHKEIYFKTVIWLMYRHIFICLYIIIYV